MLNEYKFLIDLFYPNSLLVRILTKIYKKYKKNLHMTKTNRSDLRLMIKIKGRKVGRNVMTCFYQPKHNYLYFNLLNRKEVDKKHFSTTSHKACPYILKFDKKSQEKILMRNIKFSIDTIKYS